MDVNHSLSISDDLAMDLTKTDEQQQPPTQNSSNVSQKKRNRNKSNSQVKPEADIEPEEIPIEDAMKAVSLAPHQVHNIFHFISPLIMIINV